MANYVCIVLLNLLNFVKLFRISKIWKRKKILENNKAAYVWKTEVILPLWNLVPTSDYKVLVFMQSMITVHFHDIFGKTFLYNAYIIGHYNPSVRIIDLVSHSTYVVCVIIYIIDGTYSLMSTPNNIFLLRNFSWQFYLLSDFLPEIFCRKSP